MNVLMLGNGFDINYGLLTKYINFLNITNFISSMASNDVVTIGGVLRNEKLQILDKDVAKSYVEHKSAYDNTPLEKEAIARLSALAKNNMFFSFLHKSVNRDIGWIDFEKEISVIIHAFQKFLERERPQFDIAKYPESAVDRFVIGQFAFFHKPVKNGMTHSTRRVKDEYLLEYPQGSSNVIIYSEKIIEVLEKQMLEFADGLRLYLECFVENVVNKMCILKSLHKLPALTGAKQVVTFNYTNTYERLYSSDAVYHIHGNVNNSIILGVQPDEADEVNSVDISFLRFKKYFQRVTNHSDDGYLAWIKRKHNNVSLLVMGHSLDVTDKDIIIQMFDVAKDITVLYYSASAELTLVANLIKIYGKEKFDELREKKSLRFLPQDAEYTGFAEDRQAIETAAMVSAMRQFVPV